MSYLFTSARLGFRNWKPSDLEPFAALNADPEVMRHFPKMLSEEETATFLNFMRQDCKQKGYTYFAVDTLSSPNEFIGFIGLFDQNYEAPFTPATDIGWRLKKSAWGKGYATEGAKRCLEYAFESLGLTRIIATCTHQNLPSEKVMQKIGMNKKGIFHHPKLKEYPEHGHCLWYEITKPTSQVSS